MCRLPILFVIVLFARAASAGNDTSAQETSEVTEPVCGNGVIEADEACDDGNARDHDGCDAVCQTEPLWGCGDTVLGEAVACDDDGEACMQVCPIDSFSHAR
jgi:cysteine-rich repeat protein